MSSGVDVAHELAVFLRTRRERLTPEDVDLPQRRRARRTPGLRREEVAELAGVSVDYVIRLEQARGLRPSPEVLDALARALRLSDDEHAYLFDLTRHWSAARRAGDDSGSLSSLVRALVLDRVRRADPARRPGPAADHLPRGRRRVPASAGHDRLRGARRHALPPRDLTGLRLTARRGPSSG